MTAHMLTEHRLQPLLAPRSIAVIGASQTKASFGYDLLAILERVPFAGRLHRVNPKFAGRDGYLESVRDVTGDLDLAVIAVANRHLEASLRDCIDRGARAAVIFASGYLENDASPPLLERIRGLAREARLEICGGNCLGFYNFDANVHVCAYGRPYFRPGPITLVSHSGSVFGALVHNGKLLDYNLAVSSGQELTTTCADYMSYALAQPTTRAIGLFVESIRDPAGFVAALDRAERRDIPVVVLKVGRTARSAAFALSHTGALAGNDRAFSALCDAYGVVQVKTLDEMAAALALLSHPKRAVEGRGIAAMLDSGGMRELLVDLAEDIGTPFAEIGAPARERLKSFLAPELDPVNPLDAFGTGDNLEDSLAGALETLVGDEDSAMGIFFIDVRTGSATSEAYAQAALRAAQASPKLVALATNYSGVDDDELAIRLHLNGVPVIHGTAEGLLAARHALDRRDRRPRELPRRIVEPQALEVWRERLHGEDALGEADVAGLLQLYGLETARQFLAETLEAVEAAAGQLGFPVVLKTAAEGVLHKTDRNGVILDIADMVALHRAYEDMAARLGSKVLVVSQVETGVELSFGAVRDPQFGMLVSIGAGGVLIELLRDQVFALAPLSEETAFALLRKLRLDPMFDGVRGGPALDRCAAAAAFSRFSQMVVDLEDVLSEVDINPLRVTPKRCIALDAMLIPRRKETDRESSGADR